MKTVGDTGLGGLWALEWAWQSIDIDKDNTFQLKFVF